MTVTKTYRFDIGNPRPDGKRNVWTLANARDMGLEWVIVHVADGLEAALAWTKQQKGK